MKLLSGFCFLGTISGRDRRRNDMELWRPDPTFYPSPKLAGQAPPEKLGYVALLNARQDGVPDAIPVADLDPASSSYASVTGKVDRRNPGDELHQHSGNACSA